VDALQQFDRRAEARDEGGSDGEEESDDDESEVQPGEHLFDQEGSPFDTADKTEQVLADKEEAESVTTLRLKLALSKEELKLKERKLEIERESDWRCERVHVKITVSRQMRVMCVKLRHFCPPCIMMMYCRCRFSCHLNV